MRLLSSVFRRDPRLGLVDPDLGRQRGQDGAAMGKALGMSEKRGVEDGASASERRSGEAVMDLVGGAEAERAVTMFVVVPIEEAPGVTAGVLLAAEAVRKAGAILERLEGRF